MPVTNKKDYSCITVFDDRSTQVLTDTGVILEDLFVQILSDVSKCRDLLKDSKHAEALELLENSLESAGRL